MTKIIYFVLVLNITISNILCYSICDPDDFDRNIKIIGFLAFKLDKSRSNKYNDIFEKQLKIILYKFIIYLVKTFMKLELVINLFIDILIKIKYVMYTLKYLLINIKIIVSFHQLTYRSIRLDFWNCWNC